MTRVFFVGILTVKKDLALRGCKPTTRKILRCVKNVRVVFLKLAPNFDVNAGGGGGAGQYLCSLCVPTSAAPSPNSLRCAVFFANCGGILGLVFSNLQRGNSIPLQMSQVHAGELPLGVGASLSRADSRTLRIHTTFATPQLMCFSNEAGGGTVEGRSCAELKLPEVRTINTSNPRLRNLW